MFKAKMIALTASGAFFVAGCENLTADQAALVGSAGGAAAGLVAADVFDADDDWRMIAALGGAAAGTVVAQNSRTSQCAYANGDGTYRLAACP
ncbi:glycine zipper 2TM domain-containing protein [Yoonia litorea]|uniref:17 kDa surface antigen n=1 Tax=Yoonia litorea TaxID=1123755 RepID=A0A1I6MA18_9RHOB|nr:glycine zipper 2TM domain-containing protein [Yoonia litorea]SFS12501.1 Glycine zipper 2TM domain-containing protein [Yoonia litorea]